MFVRNKFIINVFQLWTVTLNLADAQFFHFLCESKCESFFVNYSFKTLALFSSQTNDYHVLCNLNMIFIYNKQYFKNGISN